MKIKQRLYLLVFGLALGIFVLIVGVYHDRRTGFTLKKISSPFEASLKWSIDPLSELEKEELTKILSQNLNYLGSGAQCYAFITSDGNYVLKFFKIKHLLPKRWLKLIPFPGLDRYRFNKIDRRILRHQELFSSYKMAYEDLKKETGLVYIHLNKSKDLGLRVKLYDRMRNCFLIDIDKYEFIIQRKAQLIRDRIAVFMQKGDQEGALDAIQSVLDHVVTQCKKGYIDRDSGVSHNYGFGGNDVIHFDVGRITYDEGAKDPSYYQREVIRIGKKIEDWLKINYPELLPATEEIISSMIDPSLQPQ